MQGETAVLGRCPSSRSPRRRCCTPKSGWPRSSAGCCVPGEGRELCTSQNKEDVPRELLPGRTMPRHSSGLQCRGISQPSPSAASVLAKNHRNRLVWSRTAWATPAALRLLARSRGVEALSKLAPAKIGSGAWLSPGERLGKEKLFGARRFWGPRGTSALPSKVCRAL